MLRKLLSSRRAAKAAPTGSVPDGERIYAIGDIHGRLDLLEALLAQIHADDSARPHAQTRLIFLGDLVDRGPKSAQVIERLIQLQAQRPTTRFLLGNHEEVFLEALSGKLEALKFFTRIGGRETILSYGFSEDEYHALDYAELLEALLVRLPASHRAFLEAFEDMIVIGDYAFVHAGVRPDSPLAQQKISDLRWIRGEFLSHRDPFEKIIVHGHTITEQVEMTAHRIGIDTGAYKTGNLTAMAFEGDRRWVLDTAQR